MKVLSLTIQNFLSIEKAHVEFDDNGLLLIEGFNYDVDRANGAGKTAILNALSFALYERIPRKITASELVRRGTKKGSVTARVSTDTGNIWQVVRCRPKGVYFTKISDGRAEEVVLTQAEWESKLRLTYQQFIVSMYCSQANSAASPRFLLLNDADKKQFLLQLLNLDEFALCKKRIDEVVSQLLTQSSNLQNQISLCQSKIDAFSESLIDETSIQAEKSQKVGSLYLLKKSLQSCDSVPKPNLAKFQRLEDDIATRKIEFTKMRARRDVLFSEWTKLGRKIVPFNPLRACPTCGSDLNTSTAESSHNAEMEKLKQERLSLKEEIDAIDTSLLHESKINELAFKLRAKKQAESAEYDSALHQKTDIQAKIRLIDSQIENLDKKLNDNAVLVSKVQSIREKQQELQGQIKNLATEIELQKTVSNIYSPTGAQAYILDSAVALFNEQVAKYVNILWSNLTYELQSYKENVRGEVTAKFSESIVMDGKPISLGSLSGGELKALSICTDMALLGLLEQQFGIHMSPVIFDEAFDGLDASGKEFALELIKGLAQDRQVVVIDHASEMRTSFDKVLRVEKRNGISTISTDTQWN